MTAGTNEEVIYSAKELAALALRYRNVLIGPKQESPQVGTSERDDP
jgi:hypothetical protein